MIQQGEMYQFTGNVANKELVLRQTEAGKDVVNFTLIRSWKTQREDGTISEGKRVLEVALFGKRAERAVKDIRQGYLITVDGFPEARMFTVDDPENPGKKIHRCALRLNVNDFQNHGKRQKVEEEVPQ